MRRLDGKTLRQLAAGIIDELVEDDAVTDDERADLVTSLVRQWTTYEGHAALFLGGQLQQLDLGSTPLGSPRVMTTAGPRHWLAEVLGSRGIDLDLVPEIVAGLNFGQSAEAEAADGSTVRLWVNPRDHTCGVDEVEPGEGGQPSLRELALRHLLQRFGDELPMEEMDAMAAAVAEQWERFEGHASIFVNPREQLHLVLRRRADGRSDVFTQQLPVHLDDLLVSLGIPPDELPAVIAQFNLGRGLEWQTPDGVRHRLRHDPKARRIEHEKAAPKPAAAPMRPAATCRHCSALVVPSPDGSLSTTCPLCGRDVSAE